MHQILNLRFNALAILIVFAVIDVIIAFEAGRIHERRRIESEPHVYLKTKDMPVTLHVSIAEKL